MVVTIPVLLVGLMLAQAPNLAVDAPPSLQQQADQSQPQDKKPDGAQEKKTDEAQDKKPPTPPHTGVHALFAGFKEDVRHLPSKENLYIAAVGGALALAVHPADATFNARLSSHNALVNDIFKPAKYYGDTPEQVGLSIGAYAIGRIFHKPKVSHLAMDLIRAQMLTELLVEPLKFAVGRERPDLSNHQSFPSGHSAVTFAAATVIERHLGWKNAALAYAIASYVAASRLHDNVHYLSDVVFGAAVGTIAGRTVTEHGRDMWSFSPTPVPGGVAIMVTRAPH